MVTSHKPIKIQYLKTEKCYTSNMENNIFLNIVNILIFKFMAKISIAMRVKIVKTAMNISQWEIVKELTSLRSGILESLLKFQGTWNVLDQPRCGHPQKLFHRMVQKLIRSVNLGQRLRDKWWMSATCPIWY